jgi:hypothetical protein
MTILEEGFDAEARALEEFGYEDVTPEMIRAAHERWKRGEPPADIIERFAFGHFDEYPQIFGDQAA